MKSKVLSSSSCEKDAGSLRSKDEIETNGCNESRLHPDLGGAETQKQLSPWLASKFKTLKGVAPQKHQHHHRVSSSVDPFLMDSRFDCTMISLCSVI